MIKLRILDLFAGIGGISRGLESTGGFETVAFCEIEAFPKLILAKHWPNVPIYNDVKELTYDRLNQDGITVDVITAGFPCQDISTAGKGAGIKEGTRSGLWFEVARLVGELRPRYVILENVSAILSRVVGIVLGDMAALGYDCEWHCIPASAVGAQHRRDRWWGIAYPNDAGNRAPRGKADQHGPQGIEGRQEQSQPESSRQRENGTASHVPDTNSERLQGGIPHGVTNPQGREKPGSGRLAERSFGRERSRNSHGPVKPSVGLLANGLSAGLSRSGWLPEPGIERVATGVPDRTKKLKALGNSVVPQIPALLGAAILERELELCTWGQDK